MSEDTEVSFPSWSTPPNAKARAAAQRCVTALLDDLAPERVLTKAEREAATIEQHRTPTGCVLQAPDCAVSVSWFAESSVQGSLGELHVVVWRGRLSRRGGPRSAKAATIVDELVMRPIEAPTTECVWHTASGEEFSTAALAARVTALLEAQVQQR